MSCSFRSEAPTSECELDRRTINGFRAGILTNGSPTGDHSRNCCWGLANRREIDKKSAKNRRSVGEELAENLRKSSRMGVRVWSRVKRWIKNRLFTAFWPIVQSRVFVKLRSLVSQSLVPVSLCGAGAGLGAYAASAVAFPLGYGALVGAAATVSVLGLLRLHARLFPPQPSSRRFSVFRTQR